MEENQESIPGETQIAITEEIQVQSQNKYQVAISLSGGMDSTTLLYSSISIYGRVLAIFLDYGSKQNYREREACTLICKEAGVDLFKINLHSLGARLESNLLQHGGEIPEGHYQDENMKLTIVPGRNLIFASILAGIAESLKIPYIAMGIHSGDHAIYPDCRPDFYEKAKETILLSSSGSVTLLAPYLHYDKGRILKEGLFLNVPYQLTRTCYKDQELACGKCGSCNERLEAFQNIGEIDPLKYAKGKEG